MRVAQTLAYINIYTSVTNILKDEMCKMYTDVFDTILIRIRHRGHEKTMINS